jgi:hypothetical protein
MTRVTKVFRPIVGLFVDDGFLAVATLAVVGATAALLASHVGAAAGEAWLPGGCLAALLASVWRGALQARRIRRQPEHAAH